MNKKSIYKRDDNKEAFKFYEVPLGLVLRPNKVCRLEKYLYGILQAPRCWVAKLNVPLLNYGLSGLTVITHYLLYV